MPQLRRLPREDLERACAEVEKRLGSGYAKRMFANETYAVVSPALAEVRAAIATWRSVFVAPPLEEPRLPERHLAQAALLPTQELLDAAGLTPKPRKKKEADEDTHPLLENDPPDPTLPTEEEQAEIAAAQA